MALSDHTPTPASHLSPVAMAGYAVSLALLGPFVVQFLGLGMQDVPLWSVRGRVGFFGIAFGTLGVLLLSLGVAVVVASYLRHRSALLGLAVLCASLAVTLIVAVPFFLLDALQVRGIVAPEIAGRFTLASIRNAGQAVLGAAVLVALARAASLAAGVIRRNLPA